MAVSTCKKIREILSTEASGWFPNVESHGFSLFEENVTTGHTGRSMSARRLPQPSWHGFCHVEVRLGSHDAHGYNSLSGGDLM